ncbi:hypothetical protein N7478_001764 [Penicillium angulare]|uniref:uncharacterized protein n=1 Tax=Penicillium angulare TaxID=116970 RepID=UPI00254252C9|nr:uncharacterized protein N7478_001764 [Penicillium angulare]KAJ5288734.1 hypothetical protein N7478_001764 [Penicillium angulare]
MQVAEILSDVTSLRVCGHNEALSLVSANHSIAGPNDSTANNGVEQSGSDMKRQEDLRRAKELVKFHYEVKSRHANGEVDDGLKNARQNVDQVLKELL